MASNSVYSLNHGEATLSTHRWRLISNSAEFIRPYLKPGMKVLDVGCGPGSLTVDIAKHIKPGGRVTGVEVVPDPLEEARNLAKKEGVDVTFEVADAMALPYGEDEFDMVFSHQVLQHVANPVKMLEEMRRVAKKGTGVVACRESATPTWYPENPGIKKANELYMKMNKARGGNPHPGAHIHVWAQQAGFDRSQITCSAGTWCFSSPAEREYWGGNFIRRAENSEWKTNALEAGYATPEDLKEMLDGWRAYVEDDDAWNALLHGEIICRK